MRDEVERMMSRAMEGHWPDFAGFLGRAGGFPAMNLFESENALLAEVEVPGLKLEEIDVQVTGNELTIRGVRKDPSDQDSVYHRRERPVGEFRRTVRVPLDVDADKTEASLKEGILTVTLPKAVAAKPRKIAIRSAG
jgi:HSP20 family protein